jgi:Calx-beta domain
MRLVHVVAAGAAFASLAAAGGGLAAPESAARAVQETIFIFDASGAEGNSGTRALTFRVTLSHAISESASVSYRTQNETARATEDYEEAQGSLQFAPGETTKTVEVAIKGDRKVEPDEFFSVVLSNPIGATIAEPGGVGTGTIQNDDFSAPLPKCTCKRVKLRLAGFNIRPGATPLTAVVTVTMTCGTGDVADCAGFVKAVSPFATLKPTPFTCKARKCSSTNTYTLRVRIRLPRAEILEQPLKRKLRLRAGCRGVRGELRTFTLAIPSK